MSKGNQVAALLERSGLGRLLRRVPAWRGLLIFNHHLVGDGTRGKRSRDVWSGTIEQFDAQVRFLARGFEVVEPDDLADAAGGAPGRRVALTFDDGYRECHELVYPILRSHGVGAVFFLTTGFLDGTRTAWWEEIRWMVARSARDRLPAGEWLPADVPLAADRDDAVPGLLAHYKTLPGARAERFLDYLADVTGSGRREPEPNDWLTWDMAREMRRGGMAFGGHSVTHPVLARQPFDAQRAEIGGALERIRQELGERPVLFSYPEGTPGAFDAHTRAAARAEGVKLAFTNYGGLAPATADRLAIPRVSMARTMTDSRFRAIATLPMQFFRG
jgi:peptidoglycan/xylan/chitin deacetylase (PgdA/CDA1 family)